jgi:hypothetical protein
MNAENLDSIYTKPTKIDDPTKKEQKDDTIKNMKYILFYALSVVVALGINDVVTTTFKSFPNNNHLIAKVTYVIILFIITICIAFLLKDSFATI